MSKMLLEMLEKVRLGLFSLVNKPLRNHSTRVSYNSKVNIERVLERCLVLPRSERIRAK